MHTPLRLIWVIVKRFGQIVKRFNFYFLRFLFTDVFDVLIMYIKYKVCGLNEAIESVLPNSRNCLYSSSSDF